MKLKSMSILGFQSFDNSGEIFFKDRINIIVGENNSGKSAILRAMQPNLADDRHRNEQLFEEFRLNPPQITLEFDVSGQELHDELLLGGEHKIPIEYNSSPIKDFLDRLFSIKNIAFKLISLPNQSFTAKDYPSHHLFNKNINNQFAALSVNAMAGMLEIGSIYGNNPADSLPFIVEKIYRKKCFNFTAERYRVSEYSHQHADRLAPDASNLPSVLHTLAGNRGTVFSKLIEHLREIFSSVGNISIRPLKDKINMIEIRVWPTHYMNHPELSFSLNNCGNGVAQVIAILTAIMTMEKAIIMIDEINNFLHPAAVKKLLQIINSDYSHHQYIISTHSPEVVSFGNPTTVNLTKKVGYNSYVKSLSMDKVEDFRSVSDALGVSMADVFAAERVIWVEGPTEEICFNYLYRETIGILPKGLLILSVASTGDFNSSRRDRAIVYEVYRRLTEASKSLIVNSIFSFDSEKLTKAEKNSMIKESAGTLFFLPRRHLECYLIHPLAIADFISARRSDKKLKIIPLEVEQKLKEIGSESRYSQIKNWSKNLDDKDWIELVDAAKLINSVCGELSNQEVTFNKKYDSLELLKTIIKNDKNYIKNLQDYLIMLVEKVGQ